MNNKKKKAILVVSFGTSYPETRKVTIDAIEASIQNAYPDYQVYRAWTSKMILAILKERDQIHYPTVTEAFEQMKQDQITDVIVQPTHVINGIENEQMITDALAYSSSFSSIQFGTPLLTTTEDQEYVVDAILEQFKDLKENETLVFMGHGTTHYSNSIYAALDYMFKQRGHSNIFVGTVEAYPNIDALLPMIQKQNTNHIILAPFMIVAGDHATNDMAGDDADSWKQQFLSAGFDVTCVLKGLGEYESIRKLFVQHIQEVIQ